MNQLNGETMHFNIQDVFHHWLLFCYTNNRPIRTNQQGLNFNQLYLYMLLDSSYTCTDTNFHIGVSYPTVNEKIFYNNYNLEFKTAIFQYSDMIDTDNAMLYVLEYLLINYPQQFRFKVDRIVALKKHMHIFNAFSDDHSIRDTILTYCMQYGQIMNEVESSFTKGYV